MACWRCDRFLNRLQFLQRRELFLDGFVGRNGFLGFSDVGGDFVAGIVFVDLFIELVGGPFFAGFLRLFGFGEELFDFGLDGGV